MTDPTIQQRLRRSRWAYATTSGTSRSLIDAQSAYADMRQAADALDARDARIEALTAERDALTERMEGARQFFRQAAAERDAALARIDTLTADIEERTEIEGELRARVADLEAALRLAASESDQFGTWPHYGLHGIARAALGDNQ